MRIKKRKDKTIKLNGKGRGLLLALFRNHSRLPDGSSVSLSCLSIPLNSYVRIIIQPLNIITTWKCNELYNFLSECFLESDLQVFLLHSGMCLRMIVNLDSLCISGSPYTCLFFLVNHYSYLYYGRWRGHASLSGDSAGLWAVPAPVSTK